MCAVRQAEYATDMLNLHVGEARKSETSRVDIALTASQGTVENQQPSRSARRKAPLERPLFGVSPHSSLWSCSFSHCPACVRCFAGRRCTRLITGIRNSYYSFQRTRFR